MWYNIYLITLFSLISISLSTPVNQATTETSSLEASDISVNSEETTSFTDSVVTDAVMIVTENDTTEEVTVTENDTTEEIAATESNTTEDLAVIQSITTPKTTAALASTSTKQSTVTNRPTPVTPPTTTTSRNSAITIYSITYIFIFMIIIQIIV